MQCSLGHVPLFATPWTIVCQAPLSVEFSRQEYWSGLLFPTPGDLPDPGIEPMSPVSPALAGDFFTHWVTGETLVLVNYRNLFQFYGLPRWCRGKELTCQCRRCERCRFNPWVEKIPWRRKWQPPPVFLPGKSQGQRSLANYSPWDHK